MTHVEQSVVHRETGATILMEEDERIIASLTPEGLVLRPKGMSKSRGVVFPYSNIWSGTSEDSKPDDEDDWDKGYTQGQEDLKDWVSRKLKRGKRK